MPAPTAPTITTSHSVSVTVVSSASMRPAAAMAFLAASFTALLVTVAPEMLSKSTPCAATIASAKVPSAHGS